MKTDLITKGAAVKAILEWMDLHKREVIHKQDIADVIMPLSEGIIRCKDCKWYDPTHPYGTVVPDAFYCKVNDRFYKASHFCGYGERRE